MEPQEYLGYDDAMISEPLWYRDYQMTKRMLFALIGVCVIAAFVFLFTGSKLYAAGVVGIFVIIAGLIHTPFALLVLYFLLPVESAVTISPYFTLSKVMAIIVALSYLLTRLGRGLKLPLLVKVMLIFAVYAATSIFWALSSWFVVMGTITLALHIGLMIIAINTITDKKHFDLIMWSLVIGALTATIMLRFVKIEYATAAAEELGRAALGETGGAATLANSILLGFVAGGYLFFNGSKKVKVFILFFTIAVLIAVIKTQSRAGLAAMFIVPVLTSMICAKGQNKLKYFGVITGIIVLGVFAYQLALRSELLSERAKERLRGSKYNLEESGRTDIWKTGLKLYAQHPVIGIGWRNFAVVVGMEREVASAHNNIIHFVAELGSIGLAFAAIIYFYLFRTALRTSYPALKWLGMACLLYSLITGMTHTTYIFKYFWYSLTFVVIANQVSEQLQENPDFEYYPHSELENDGAYLAEQQQCSPEAE